MRPIAITLVGAALAGAAYLLLVDTTSPPELYVLAAVSLMAGIAFEASREQGFAEARISPRWLRGAWRAVVRVPSEIVLLCREAADQLRQPERERGEFRTIPFRGGDGESDRGRYALTEIVGSLAPNTIVIGIDPDAELLLVHQLRRSGGADELDVLGMR